MIHVCTRWDRQKDYWLLYVVTDDRLLEVIQHYTSRYPFDYRTTLWLASRGVKGEDNGGSYTEQIALNYGNYVPRIEVRDGSHPS